VCAESKGCPDPRERAGAGSCPSPRGDRERATGAPYGHAAWCVWHDHADRRYPTSVAILTQGPDRGNLTLTRQGRRHGEPCRSGVFVPLAPARGRLEEAIGGEPFRVERSAVRLVRWVSRPTAMKPSFGWYRTSSGDGAVPMSARSYPERSDGPRPSLGSVVGRRTVRDEGR